jgi:hypothetical protein
LVSLSDVVIFRETESEKTTALRILPTRIRRLQYRAARALRALTEEDRA